MTELRRKVISQAKQGSLPSAYRQIEYLESTGTQYINTLLELGANDFKAEIQFERTKDISREQAIASIWISRMNYWNLFIRNYDSRWIIDCYTGGHHMGKDLAINTKYNVSVERSGTSWTLLTDDSSTNWTYSPANINNTSLKLFTRGDVPSTQSSETNIKMYSCKLSVSGELKRNYIPCVRKADSKPGMYDTVSKTFFTNAGTDEFIIPT